MPKPLIFISHSAPEHELAEAFRESISAAFLGAVEVFVSSDPSSIGAGARWMDSITAALKTCAVEIILASPASVERPWINFEAGAGWVRDIPVIPVCHSGMTPSTLPPPLSLVQGVVASNPDDLERLLFRAIAEAAGMKTPKISFDRLAKRVIAIEARIAPATRAQANLARAAGGSTLSLRVLSDERRGLETETFGLLLELQTLRGQGKKPSDARLLERALSTAAAFMSEPTSLTDTAVADLRDLISAANSDLRGGPSPKKAPPKKTPLRTNPQTDAELRSALLQAAYDQYLHESKTGAIDRVDLTSLVTNNRTTLEHLQDILSDLMLEGRIEAHYPTLGEGPMDGAVTITQAGLQELRRGKAGT